MVEKSMEQRKPMITNYRNSGTQHTGGSIVAEDNGEESYRFYSEMVMPIVSQGDPIGAVVICDKEGGTELGDLERKVAQSAAGVMAKQIEQ